MTDATPASTPGKTTGSAVMHLVRALLAGLLFVGYLQVRPPYFDVPKEHQIVSLGESKERWDKYLSEIRRVDRLNKPIDFAVLGALLTGALAMGRFACCRPVLRVLGSIPAGAIVGAVTGSVGCFAQQTIIPYEVQATVALTSQVHAVLFGTLGIGVGFLVGLFNRSGKAALAGAIAGGLGGALAGPAYAILSSVLMPSANVEPLIPPQLNSQFLWLGLGTGLIGLTIPVGACQAVVTPACAVEQPEPSP